MFRLLQGAHFENAIVLGQFNTKDECYDKMKEELAKDDIIMSYERHWKENDNLEVIDYGSWSTYFYIYKIEQPTVQVADNRPAIAENWADFITHNLDYDTMKDWFDNVVIPNHLVLSFWYDPGTDGELAEYIIPVATMALNNKLFILATFAEGVNTIEDASLNFLHFYDVEDLIVNKDMEIIYGDQLFSKYETNN